MPTTTLLEFNRKNNQTTAEAWDLYAPHRAKVTSLVLEARSALDPARSAEPPTLAIIGAGNCNDIDLEELAPQFGAVHLVDIDCEAIGRARERQSRAVADTIVLHGPVDLSGDILTRVASGESRASVQELERLASAGAEIVARVFPHSFDIVVSNCLLSQLMHACYLTLGGKDPRLMPVACATAVSHLQSFVRMIKPGGLGLLVTDVVSSDTVKLERIDDEIELSEFVRRLEKSRRVLTGTGPGFVSKVLATDPAITPLVQSQYLVAPWLAQFRPTLRLVVYAAVIQR